MHYKTLETKLYKAGLPKMGQLDPFGGHYKYSGGHYRYSGGQEQQRRKRGAMIGKETTGGHEIIN